MTSNTMELGLNTGADVKAIGVVILPSAEISELAIALSNQLKNPPFVLGSDYIPHVTLFQGYAKDIEVVKSSVTQALKNIRQFDATVHMLEIEEMEASPDWEMFKIWQLTMQRDGNIMALHNQLVQIIPEVDIKEPLSGYFVRNGNEMIVKGALMYVRDFKRLYSGINYLPHITIGGERQPHSLKANLPQNFTVNKIALFQLGNFCTCRRILAEWQLKK